jgi:hypothetical protein
MSSEHSFYTGPRGVAAFDQQHSAALEDLRGASAFMVVIAERDANGDMQTRVLAASRDGGLLGAACCVRAIEYGVEALTEMQAAVDEDDDVAA